MATPRRRSSRLSGVKTPSRLPATPTTNKLSSLIERDESPPQEAMNMNAVVATPVIPNTAPQLARFSSIPTVTQTPQTISRIAPPRSEMHPSKTYQSTQRINPGPLNSNPPAGLTRSPSKIAIATNSQRTPLKRHSIAPQTMTSPTFDFTFSKPDSSLSSEAQKIMDSVREEAARIKAQMVEERDKQKQADEEAGNFSTFGGRQIRKPKGKSGRFSDIHRAEFRKMDSIANHTSTWKAKFSGVASSPLKRSPSKAGLDEETRSIPRVKSFRSLYGGSSDRLENTAPGKRAKRAYDEDTSKARPDSRDAYLEVTSTTTSPIKSPAPSLPSAVTTPTKSSLARSASVKSLRTTMIPTLTKSASTKTLRSPPKTESSLNKRLGSWSKFGGNVKSILHRAAPKYSNDPSKLASGTHLPLPRNAAADTEKSLPSLPDTPNTIKHVNFTPSTKSRHEAALAAASPTPSKPSHSNIGSRNEVSSSPPAKAADPVTYPDLSASPHITLVRAKSPKAGTPMRSPGPENLTFRGNDVAPIAFSTGAKPVTSSPSKPTSIPISAARTIRPVHPSGQVTTTRTTTTAMPGAFTSSSPAIAQPIPHGIKNKKRKHEADSDDEVGNDGDDRENVDPDTNKIKVVEGNPAKKARTGPAPVAEAKKLSEAVKAKKKKVGMVGGISLSRLNMLARPKERK